MPFFKVCSIFANNFVEFHISSEVIGESATPNMFETYAGCYTYTLNTTKFP